MTVDENACRTLGLDVKKVAALARRLDAIGADARAMGLKIFGNSGQGLLVATAPSQLRQGDASMIEVAAIQKGIFDGGDGEFVDLPEAC